MLNILSNLFGGNQTAAPNNTQTVYVVTPQQYQNPYGIQAQPAYYQDQFYSHGYPQTPQYPQQYPQFDQSGGYGLMQMCMSMMEQMMGLLINCISNNQNQYPPVLPPANDAENPVPPNHDNCYPPTYPPATDTSGIRGSAGLVGDPKFMLLTPQLQNDASLDPLKSFQSGIAKNQTVTLLKDADDGGFQVDGTGVQVDPANGNSIGIGNAKFTISGQEVEFANNGDLVIDGDVVGNIKDEGTLGFTLADGSFVGTGNRIDDAAGNQKERFIVRNGEYEVTAALRSPHADSANYLDMNFEELTNGAANNATGYQTNVTGFGSIGIADLLKREPAA